MVFNIEVMTPPGAKHYTALEVNTHSLHKINQRHTKFSERFQKILYWAVNMFVVQFVVTSIGIALLHSIIRAIYRLRFTPLSKTPGPKCAAITTFYETYFDLVEGRLPWKLEELHNKFGRIVRIGPNEVHIHDPHFTPIFFSSSKRDKWRPHQNQLGIPDSTMSTINCETHRIRRGALAPFFSSANVHSYSPIVITRIEKMSRILHGAESNGEVLELRRLFWCMLTDIVTAITFPEGMSLLDDLDVGKDWYAFHKGGQGKLLWFKHFPVLWEVMRGMPPRWLLKMAPQAASALEWETLNKSLAGNIISRKGVLKEAEKYTVFHQLLKSNLLLPEKELARVWQDASSLVGGGVETISNTLCVIIVHLLQNPQQMSTLVAELKAAIPNTTDSPSVNIVTGLPYLSAVIQEGLRKAVGIVSRVIRVATNDNITYDSHVLPPGTGVSVSAYLSNNDPSIFREPEKFKPERWLPGPGGLSEADKRLMITFGGGTRKCLGMHLAQTELALTLAVMFRRFHLELFETGFSDVDAKYDSVLPLPDKESKGVRVLVNRIL